MVQATDLRNRNHAPLAGRFNYASQVSLDRHTSWLPTCYERRESPKTGGQNRWTSAPRKVVPTDATHLLSQDLLL